MSSRNIEEKFPTVKELDGWIPTDIVEGGVLAYRFETRLVAYRIFERMGIWDKIYGLIEQRKRILAEEESKAQREESYAFMPKSKESKLKKQEKEHGSKLEEYDDIATEAEPLPTKYYEWKNSGEEKEFKFVLQRHWPTGRKEEIKPGEKVPEMHKGLGILEEAPNELIQWLENSSLRKQLFRIMKIRDHLDLRMEISKEKLIGVTIHPPVPGDMTTWDSFKERMDVGDKTQVTPKYEHPYGWLGEEGELRFPTRHTAPGEKEQVAHYIEIARMEIIDKGTVKFGVQRKNAHEYFFYGKHLKGRWVLRRLTIGVKYPHEAWLLMKPEDQKPMDPSYHKDTGYYKIDWIKAPTTEQREAIEQEVERARLERKAEDWCKDSGGKWITSRGRHICVGLEENDPDKEGYKRIIIFNDKYNRTRLHVDKEVAPDLVDRVRSATQFYPAKVTANINDVWVHQSTLDDAVVGANFYHTGLIELSDVRFVNAEGEFHHEVGHTVWNRNFKTAEQLEWALIDESPVSIYGRKSTQEDFCETLKRYQMDPELLEKERPRHYKLIKKNLEELRK